MSIPDRVERALEMLAAGRSTEAAHFLRTAWFHAKTRTVSDVLRKAAGCAGRGEIANATEAAKDALAMLSVGQR